MIPLDYLLWMLCQGGVLILVGLIADGLLKNPWARRRLWCVLWLMVALWPFASVMIPDWLFLKSATVAPGRILNVSSPPPLESVAHLPLLPEDDLSIALSPRPAALEPDVDDTAPLWVVKVWAMMATLFLLRLWVCQLILWRWRRRSRPAEEGWRVPHGCRSEIRVSERIAVPMTWGLFRPVIMIPERERDYAADEKAFILRHECEHIRNRDAWWLLLAQITLCLHWLNPLAWWAKSRLRLAQEQCCDAAVAAAGGVEPAAYGTFLLHAARASRPVTHALPLALAMIPTPARHLKSRLKHILDPNMKTTSSKKWNFSVAVVVIAVAFILATLGWQSPTLAHDSGDPTLDQKLREKVIEQVVLEDSSVAEAVDYVKAQLEASEVNIVILRGAQNAMQSNKPREDLLERLIAVQKERMQEARRKMLDVMERFWVTDLDPERLQVTAEQTEKHLLETEFRIANERMRIDTLSGLAGDGILRLITNEFPDETFLNVLTSDYAKAHSDLEELRASHKPDSSLVENAKAALYKRRDRLVDDVKQALNTKLEMAEKEQAIVADIRQTKINDLLHHRKRAWEYEESQRNYERQLAALEDLRQRQLTQELSTAKEASHEVSLSLKDVNLADTMDYVLQLAGLDYVLRRNTVVIGTPDEISGF